ncbi:hypothetical protein GCM10023321_83780 [Pseudonocardia eucalypti]|uniref:DUF2867 domain-containing protein n=1 Tax=Pseudonocardia eucalypti TaxID=648755 RepID=A0ABP9RF91_9PSEU|nr:hypothetical protein [Pseudonocardia eucalypti]
MHDEPPMCLVAGATGYLGGRLEPRTLLRLRAEMKVPGLAWLELGIQEEDGGRATYRQRAIFVPRGLAGHLYWWSVAPFHAVVFGGMARNITRTAERAGPDHGTPPSPGRPR